MGCPHLLFFLEDGRLEVVRADILAADDSQADAPQGAALVGHLQSDVLMFGEFGRHTNVLSNNT